MKHIRFSLTIALVIFISRIAVAEEPTATVESVIARTQAVVQNASEDEIKFSTKSLLLEVTRLTRIAEKLSGHKIGLPGRLGSLRLSDFREMENTRGGRNLLIVSKGGSITSIDNSILLVDGSIEVPYASSSLIIATEGVKIAHGSHNVVITGKYLHVSHDGSYESRPGTKRNKNSSLLLSGNVIDLSFARRTVISTPGKLSISFANRVTGINITNSDISYRNDMKDVVSTRLPIIFAPFSDIVGSEVLYYPPASTEDDYASGELCFASEEPVILPASKIVAGCCGTNTLKLAGWKQVAAFNYSLYFSKDGEIAQVQVAPEPKIEPRICNFKDVPHVGQP